jgi:hypothetical protein
MGLVNRLESSDRQIAANRENAGKSTGPRTPAGKRRAAMNAFRHGLDSAGKVHARSILAKRGENPPEWRRMYRQLMADLRPLGCAESMLVEDLANLYWAKVGLRRARAASELRRLDDRARRYERETLMAKSQPLNPDHLDRQGVRRGREDCPEKFAEVIKLLDQLSEFAGRGEPDAAVDETLRLLYGTYPTRLGIEIIDLFGSLGDEESQDGPTDVDRTCARLKTAIAEERALVVEERKSYESEQDAMPTVDSEMVLVPLSSTWEMVEAQDASLDRRIERKIRVLLELQEHRRAGERRRGSTAEIDEKEPAALASESGAEANSAQENFSGGTKPPGTCE